MTALLLLPSSRPRKPPSVFGVQAKPTFGAAFTRSAADATLPRRITGSATPLRTPGWNSAVDRANRVRGRAQESTRTAEAGVVPVGEPERAADLERMVAAQHRHRVVDRRDVVSAGNRRVLLDHRRQSERQRRGATNRRAVQ